MELLTQTETFVMSKRTLKRCIKNKTGMHTRYPTSFGQILQQHRLNKANVSPLQIRINKYTARMQIFVIALTTIELHIFLLPKPANWFLINLIAFANVATSLQQKSALFRLYEVSSVQSIGLFFKNYLHTLTGCVYSSCVIRSHR